MKEENLFLKAQKIRCDEQMVAFDFSIAEHRDYFVSEFGGEKYFQNNFPEMYDRFKAACLRDSAKKSNTQVGEHDAFQDAVDIFYGFYDGEHIVAKGVTSIKSNVENICHRFHVYEPSFGHVVMECGTVSENCHHAVYEISKPVVLSKNTKSLTFDYFSTWCDSQDGLHAAIYNSTDELVWDGINYVEKVTMRNPIHKKTSEDSPIVVCYNRKSTSGETVDYDSYQEAFDPNNHIQRLYLDVGADVELSSEALPFSAVDISRLLLKLDCQSGIASYSKEERVQEIQNAFRATDNGFTFDLDKDWRGVVPAARLPQKEPVDFLMRTEFYTSNNTKKGRFIVDSRTNAETTSEFILPISQLHLLWGCISGDTPVLMKDGTFKPACSIEIGDFVRQEHGFAKVIDVIAGKETKPLLCIETVNGRKVCCTGDHPILTNEGFICSDKICGKHKIKDLKDGFVGIKSIYPVEWIDVYSFKLDSNGDSYDYNDEVMALKNSESKKQEQDSDKPEHCKSLHANESHIICDYLILGDYDMQCDAIEKNRVEEDLEKKQIAAFEASAETVKLKEFFERNQL